MSEVFLLRARTLLAAPREPAVADGGVLVEGGVVRRVGRYAEVAEQARGVRVVDVDGTLMPGMIDAHSHLRGMPLSAHGIPPRPLESWLCSLAAMTPLPPGDEARLAAAELLQTGVTAVQGILHSFDDGDGYRSLLTDTAEGIQDSGIRALLVLGFSDRAERAPEPAEGGWALVPPVRHRMSAQEFGRVASSWLAEDEEGALLRWGLGPVASQWASADALAAFASGFRRARIHTHLNESRFQRSWIAGDAAPVPRLDSAGLFDSRLSAAHAVHLTAEELDLVAARGVALVHCPASNLALGVGTARVAEWLRRGIPAALGLDSQNPGRPDVFAVMRQAIDSSESVGDPLDEVEALGLATTGGAAALGAPALGRIAPGSPADLVALSLVTDPGEAAVAVVREGSAELVHSVWVAGRERVTDGRAPLDTSSLRLRLQAALDADAAARSRRLDEVADSVGRVEELLAECAR